MIALATTAIGWLIFVVSVLGWVIYYFANRKSARPELGSEIELAPNRRPYYDDETLEGSRLDGGQLHRGVAAGDDGHRSSPVLGAGTGSSGGGRQREGVEVRRLGSGSAEPPPTEDSTAPGATAA